jgi:hypothetical protein
MVHLVTLLFYSTYRCEGVVENLLVEYSWNIPSIIEMEISD